MSLGSFWHGTGPATQWPVLEGELQVDVAIVGGGITGLTLALLLAEQGCSIALVEGRRIGDGTTGQSTGNLYETVSAGLHSIRNRWDAQVARSVALSRRAAIDAIEQRAADLPDVAFRRCPMYWAASSPSAVETIDAELQAARDAGLRTRYEDSLPPGLPAVIGPVLVIDYQAQFHPMAYLDVMAQQAAERGGRLFELSAALEVDPERHFVRTERGRVRARDIVLATHSPSGFHAVQAGMLPQREYAVAAPVRDGFPPGIFWSKGEEQWSVRSARTRYGPYLLCIGPEHKSGQHDAGHALRELEALAAARFDLRQPAFRWSAQNFRSADGLPYIGRDASGAYIAAGFETDGLVWGTLAASVIADQIAGRENPWSALYSPSRFQSLKSAKGVTRETVSTVRALAQDALAPRRDTALASLAPGQAAIVDIDGERLAAYRDDANALFVVSDVCTHMKCRVRWNDAERSWDCPCHGSRFGPDGRVLEGPALEPLTRKMLQGS